MEQVAGRLSRIRDRAVTRMPATRTAARCMSISPKRWSASATSSTCSSCPKGRRCFRPQTVTIHQVQDAAGRPWEPDPEADVLLLGDSFTNVFSLDPMGWGESAGLGPQLALALGPQRRRHRAERFRRFRDAAGARARARGEAKIGSRARAS